MKIFLIFILVFSFLNAIPKTLDKEKILRKVTSEDLGEIDINVIYTNRIYMTSEGNFFFMTNYNDTEANIFDASDIEEYTFSTKITASETYSYDSYDVNCRLWKPLKENLRVFCQVVNYYSSKKMVFNKAVLYYNGYYVNILPPPQETYPKSFTLTSASIPFIYSAKQFIDLEEDQESIELKFKIKEYNNQELFLYSENSYNYLEKCIEDENFLKCSLTRKEIEEFMLYNNQIFSVYSYDTSLGLFKIELIGNITINYIISQKRNIYVEIGKSLQNVTTPQVSLAYQTNVTDISSIITKNFTVLVYKNNENKQISCYLRKNAIDPLLFLCQWELKPDRDDFLGEIKNEIIIDTNIKYNFFIQPGANYEIFRGYSISIVPISLYPKTFNFTSTDTLNIKYIMTSPGNFYGFYILTDLPNLNCRTYNNIIYNCTLESKYFENITSGYLYTYQNIYMYQYYNYSIVYDFPPINVILPKKRIYIHIVDENRYDRLIIGESRRFYFETYFNDSDNVFDDDIEQLTLEATITDDSKKDYNISCNLWKPKNDKMRLFCKIIENVSFDYNRIHLNEFKFNYKEYSVVVYQNNFNYINIYKVNYSIPFLYSEKQTIDVIEGINSYSLKFQIEEYNNELLILYGLSILPINMKTIDKCEKNAKILTCKISKEKLEEILTNNDESFGIMVMDDNVGVIKLKNILNIIIHYDISRKTDLYIGINEILGGKNQRGNPVAFQTNITSISNLISLPKLMSKDKYCYFKKTQLNPLYFICIYDYSFTSYVETVTKEIILDDIHYRYNFRIQPYTIISTLSITGSGSCLYLSYPEELNFKLQKLQTIRFIFEDPLELNNIALINTGSALDPNQPLLNCKTLEGMKVCNVSASHFSTQNYQESGYYNIYHSHYYYDLMLDYAANPIKITLPKNIITISISKDENTKTKTVCQNGIVYLLTNFDDTKTNLFDASTIEEKTKFEIKFVKNPGKNIIGSTCRLWKQKNGKLVIICNLDQTLDNFMDQNIQVYFNETIFDYNGYNVFVISDVFFNFQVVNKFCPFLYSEEQSIKVTEEQQSYKINFKIEEYNNEPLLLSTLDFGYINIYNCDIDGKNLLCEISKDSILENYNNQNYKLYYYDELYGFEEFGYFPGISFDYTAQKQTLYVKISKLVTNNAYLNNHIAFETNVSYSNVFNITTTYFLLDPNKGINCFLKKTNNKPLYILCRYLSVGDYSLGEIKNEIKLDNINIKYNFRILPVSNNEIFYIRETGSIFSFSYPQLLDFYKNDTLTIGIRMQYPENTKELYLGTSLNPLSCQNSQIASSFYKRCLVNKNILKDYSGQFVYFYQKFSTFTYQALYELSPILIIIPKDNEIILRITKENNKNPLIIGTNGVLSFITNYNDYEKNVFNNSNITEQQILFDTKIIDENKNEYKVKCKIWSPYNDKVRLICNLNNNLKYQNQKIILKDVTFDFYGYEIIITSDIYIEVKQFDYSISFLYSDRQKINIDFNSQIHLTFKYETYSNDILYLYGSYNNSLLIEKCEPNSNKEIICELEHEKLGKIIPNVDYFQIGAINDNFGVYLLNNILPIEIRIDDIDQKEDIYVQLNEPFGLNTEIGLPFGYITNITDIDNLITEKDDICYFKKVTGMPLLYACIIEYEKSYYFSRQTKEKKILNAHWKYNFIIAPYNKFEIFFIRNYTSEIILSYPEFLNFKESGKESLIISFIMTKPSLNKNIKFNLYSSDLECKDLIGMKKCIVSLANFRNDSSDYFYIYHSNTYTKETTLFYGVNPILVTLPEMKSIELSIGEENNFIQYLSGANSIIYFVTNYKDTLDIIDSSEISKLSFNVKFTDNLNDKIINSSCYLWKPLKENIRLICKLNDKFDNGEQIISFYDTSIKYGDYFLFLYKNYQNLKINSLNTNISFLYSDIQEINIDDNIDTYKLVFKKEIYNNEKLILSDGNLKNIYLDCNNDVTEVICNLKKNELIKILSLNEEKFFISQLINSEGILSINSILEINIKYDNAKKKEINLEITKLLTPFVDLNNYIIYETNIIDIPPITTDVFDLKSNRNDITKCFFKKNSDNKTDKLLLFCLATTPGKNSLGSIDEMTLNNINILYDFKIKQSQNDDYCTISNEIKSKIFSIYPEEIDFNKKDSFIITYRTENPQLLKGIKLNNESSTELVCSNKIGIKECTITQSHFTKSGNYYTYYDNSFGYQSISYEIPTIKVTLKINSSDSNDSSSSSSYAGVIAGSIIGGLIIIALIIYIIWRIKKKNSYSGIGGNTEEITAPLNSNIELKEELK